MIAFQDIENELCLLGKIEFQYQINSNCKTMEISIVCIKIPKIPTILYLAFDTCL